MSCACINRSSAHPNRHLELVHPENQACTGWWNQGNYGMIHYQMQVTLNCHFYTKSNLLHLPHAQSIILQYLSILVICGGHRFKKHGKNCVAVLGLFMYPPVGDLCFDVALLFCRWAHTYWYIMPHSVLDGETRMLIACWTSRVKDMQWNCSVYSLLTTL